MPQASSAPRSNAARPSDGVSVDGRDVRPLQAALLHAAHDQEVRAGALLEADALALQVGQRADRRIGRHQDRRTGGLGRLEAGVPDVLARGLREDGRRVAGEAEVEAADGQRLEDLRAGRELDPLRRTPGRRASSSLRSRTTIRLTEDFW
jgi:hypothetical protein